VHHLHHVIDGLLDESSAPSVRRLGGIRPALPDALEGMLVERRLALGDARAQAALSPALVRRRFPVRGKRMQSDSELGTASRRAATTALPAAAVSAG